MSANLMSLIMPKSEPLPYDAEVEWLEANGTQFIDTGVFGSGDVEVECDVMVTHVIDRLMSVFGSRFAYTNRQFYAVLHNTDERIFTYRKNNGAASITDKLPIVGEKFSIKLLENTSSVFGAGIDYTVSLPQFTNDWDTPKPIVLFGYYDNLNFMQPFFGRFYDCLIRKAGSIKRNFIPVRFTNENGVSEGAMYDKVSGQLFRNQGTGAFVIGPDKGRSLVLSKLFGDRKMVKQGYTAHDYVQDGLIAMWDGIENAGWGVHDETTRTWKDLVGTNDLTLGINVDWADTHDGIYLYSQNGGAFRSGKISPYTLEMVLKRTADAPFGICFQDTTDYTGGNTQATQAFGWKNRSIGQNFNGYYAAPVGTAFSFNYKKYPHLSENVFSLNGHYVPRSSDYEIWSIPGTAIGVGGRSNGSATYTNVNNMVGYVYACRLYDRHLTDSEIAANYEIDKARFNLP